MYVQIIISRSIMFIKNLTTKPLSVSNTLLLLWLSLNRYRVLFLFPSLFQFLLEMNNTKKRNYHRYYIKITYEICTIYTEWLNRV